MIQETQCLIIGSGPAGYTAAIYAARADMKPMMYEGLQPGGQLTTTNEVENFPGYPTGVSGPEMMVQLRDQALRFETDIRTGFINKVDFSGNIHKCWADDGTEIHAHTVIIATGASAKYLGLPSEQHYLQTGGGVSACAVCDGFFYRGQETVIVGAGDLVFDKTLFENGIVGETDLVAINTRGEVQIIDIKALGSGSWKIFNSDLELNRKINELKKKGLTEQDIERDSEVAKIKQNLLKSKKQ